MNNKHTSKVQAAAYRKSQEIFYALSFPPAQHIIASLEQRRGLTASELTTDDYKTSLILDHIRSLEKIGLLRRERLGSQTIFNLNYDRLETINAAATGLL